MADDFRLAFDYFDHFKVRNLKEILGPAGVLAHLQLLSFTGKYRPKGRLTGMNPTDIAKAAHWEGEPETLLGALTSTKLVDKHKNGLYVIHDWREHNGYLYYSRERSENSRQAAKAKWTKRDKKLRAAEKGRDHRTPDAPSPSPLPLPSPIPSPTPIPKEEQSGRPDPVPYEEIVSHLNKIAGKHYRHTSETTRTLLKARWKEGFTVQDFFRVHINKARKWLDDPEWEYLLRPITLYRASKFEGYLNEREVPNSNLSERSRNIIRTAQEFLIEEGLVDDQCPESHLLDGDDPAPVGLPTGSGQTES